jgi:hypothetical protein
LPIKYPPARSRASDDGGHRFSLLSVLNTELYNPLCKFGIEYTLRRFKIRQEAPHIKLWQQSHSLISNLQTLFLPTIPPVFRLPNMNWRRDKLGVAICRLLLRRAFECRLIPSCSVNRNSNASICGTSGFSDRRSISVYCKYAAQVMEYDFFYTILYCNILKYRKRGSFTPYT